MVDRDGSLLIIDSGNDRVLRVSADGSHVTRVIGTDHVGSTLVEDDPTRTQLAHPKGVVVDRDGSLLITDSGNHRVLRVYAGFEDEFLDKVVAEGRKAKSGGDQETFEGAVRSLRLIAEVPALVERLRVIQKELPNSYLSLAPENTLDCFYDPVRDRTRMCYVQRVLAELDPDRET